MGNGKLYDKGPTAKAKKPNTQAPSKKESAKKPKTANKATAPTDKKDKGKQISVSNQQEGARSISNAIPSASRPPGVGAREGASGRPKQRKGPETPGTTVRATGNAENMRAVKNRRTREGGEGSDNTKQSQRRTQGQSNLDVNSRAKEASQVAA